MADLSPNRPRDNQQYQAPTPVFVNGGANAGQMDWGAFYNDILPYYQKPGLSASGVDVNTLDRLPQGDPPGWSNVDRITMTAAQIANGEVITGIPLPRARPKDHVASEATIAYVPSASALTLAPELGANFTPNAKPLVTANVGNPGANFGVEIAVKPQGIIGEIFAGIGKMFGVAQKNPNGNALGFGVNVNANGIQLSANGTPLDVSQFQGLIDQATGAMNFEFVPADWQMPTRGAPTFTQAQVDEQWRKGNLNEASYAALNDGKISYTNSDGAVLPTTSISGKVRNTYGD
jgi:hypothetical protein